MLAKFDLILNSLWTIKWDKNRPFSFSPLHLISVFILRMEIAQVNTDAREDLEAQLNLDQIKSYLNEDSKTLLQHLNNPEEPHSSSPETESKRTDKQTYVNQASKIRSSKRTIALFARNNRLTKPSRIASPASSHHENENEDEGEEMLVSNSPTEATLVDESDPDGANSSPTVAAFSTNECVIQGKRIQLSKSDVQKFTRNGKWRCGEFFRFKTFETPSTCEFCSMKCKTSIDDMYICQSCRHFAYKALVKHHMFVCKNKSKPPNETCQYRRRLRDNTMSSSDDEVYCRYCHFYDIINRLPSLRRLQKHLVLFVKNRVLFVNSVSKKTMMWKSRLMAASNSESNKSNSPTKSAVLAAFSKNSNSKPRSANATKSLSVSSSELVPGVTAAAASRKSSQRNLLEIRTSSRYSLSEAVAGSRKASSNDLKKELANISAAGGLTSTMDKENDLGNEFETEFNQEDFLCNQSVSEIKK